MYDARYRIADLVHRRHDSVCYWCSLWVRGFGKWFCMARCLGPCRFAVYSAATLDWIIRLDLSWPVLLVYDGIVTITSRYTLRFILLMNDYISNRTSDATTRRLWYKIGTIHEEPSDCRVLGSVIYHPLVDVYGIRIR